MRQGDEAETDPDMMFLLVKIFPLMLVSTICSLISCTYVVGFMGPWAIPLAFFTFLLTWSALKLNTWWQHRNNEKDLEMQKMGDHDDPKPEEKENFEVMAAMTGAYVPCIIGNVQKTIIITAIVTFMVKLLAVIAVMISAHLTNFWPEVRHGKISLLGCVDESDMASYNETVLCWMGNKNSNNSLPDCFQLGSNGKEQKTRVCQEEAEEQKIQICTLITLVVALILPLLISYRLHKLDWMKIVEDTKTYFFCMKSKPFVQRSTVEKKLQEEGTDLQEFLESVGKEAAPEALAKIVFRNGETAYQRTKSPLHQFILTKYGAPTPADTQLINRLLLHEKEEIQENIFHKIEDTVEIFEGDLNNKTPMDNLLSGSRHPLLNDIALGKERIGCEEKQISEAREFTLLATVLLEAAKTKTKDKQNDAVILNDGDQKSDVEEDTEAKDLIKESELRDNEKDEGKNGIEKLAHWVRGEEPGLGVALATVVWRISTKVGVEEVQKAKKVLKHISTLQNKNGDSLETVLSNKFLFPKMNRIVSGEEKMKMSEILTKEVTEFLSMISTILEESIQPGYYGPLDMCLLAWRVTRGDEKLKAEKIVRAVADIQGQNILDNLLRGDMFPKLSSGDVVEVDAEDEGLQEEATSFTQLVSTVGEQPSNVYKTVKNDDKNYNQDTKIGITHANVVLSKEHPALAMAIMAFKVSTGEQRQVAENVLKILGLEEPLTEERVTSFLDYADLDRRFRDWKMPTGILHYSCYNI